VRCEEFWGKGLRAKALTPSPKPEKGAQASASVIGVTLMVNNIILFIKDYLDAFSFIGSIFSALSFIFTIMIFFKLKRIHSEYLFKIRTPELLKKLESTSENISKYFVDFSRFIDDINREFTLCKVNLGSLKNKCPKEIKKSVSKTIKLILSYLKITNCSKKQEDANKIYIEIQAIVEECKNYWEDIKWGGRYE